MRNVAHQSLNHCFEMFKWTKASHEESHWKHVFVCYFPLYIYMAAPFLLCLFIHYSLMLTKSAYSVFSDWKIPLTTSLFFTTSISSSLLFISHLLAIFKMFSLLLFLSTGPDCTTATPNHPFNFFHIYFGYPHLCCDIQLTNKPKLPFYWNSSTSGLQLLFLPFLLSHPASSLTIIFFDFH